METLITVVLTLLGGGIVAGAIYAIVSLRNKMNGMVEETDRSIHHRMDMENTEIDRRFDDIHRNFERQLNEIRIDTDRNTEVFDRRLQEELRNLDDRFQQVHHSIDELHSKIDSRYDKLYSTFFKVVELENQQKSK